MYLGASVILSIFISLFWLLFVIAIHFGFECYRQSHYIRDRRNVLLHALWEVKLDIGLAALAFAVALYVDVIMGLLGIQSATRVAQAARVGARAAAWERNLRTFLLTIDEITRVSHAAYTLGLRHRRGGKSQGAAIVPAVARADVPAWRGRWGWGDRIGLALVTVGLTLIVLAPLLTPHDVAGSLMVILEQLKPFPAIVSEQCFGSIAGGGMCAHEELPPGFPERLLGDDLPRRLHRQRIFPVPQVHSGTTLQRSHEYGREPVASQIEPFALLARQERPPCYMVSDGRRAVGAGRVARLKRGLCLVNGVERNGMVDPCVGRQPKLIAAGPAHEDHAAIEIDLTEQRPQLADEGVECAAPGPWRAAWPERRGQDVPRHRYALGGKNRERRATLLTREGLGAEQHVAALDAHPS
jgi:hypothetical protein